MISNLTNITASIGLAEIDRLYVSTSIKLVGVQTISGSTGYSGSITKIDSIAFDVSGSQATGVGKLAWDSGAGTLNLGLLGGNVNLLLGEALYAYVYNAEATSLTKGEVVFITGSQGNTLKVMRASASAELGSANTLGFVAETILAGANGYVITEGPLRKLDTTGLTEGSLLYVSESAGKYTTVIPSAPNHSVRLGYVQKVDATQGIIYVKVDNGYELDELHNVKITTQGTGDLIVSSGSVWVNSKQLTGSYGVTGSFNITGSLLINGTTYTAATSGISGTAGSSGTGGVSGTAGSSGTAGKDGTSGISIAGTSGTTGSSGTAGRDGTSGTTGSSGTAGRDGTSGITGSSGTAGSSGTSITITNQSDNQVVTSDGTGGLQAEANLAVSGSIMVFTGSFSVINSNINIASGSVNVSRPFGERSFVTTINTGAVTINLDSGSLFSVSVTEDISVITITGSYAMTTGFSLITTGDGTSRTITWPFAIKWPGGTAPTYTSGVSKKDIFSFITTNQGTSWYGLTAAQDYL